MALVFLVLALTAVSWALWKFRRPLGLELSGGQTVGEVTYDDAHDAQPPPQFRLSARSSFTPPDALPLKTRQYFFAPGEGIFYAELLATLAGSSFRVFPKARLDTIFQFTAPVPGLNLSRLAEHSVGFLVVEMPEFQPVLGLMLENGSAKHTGPGGPPDDPAMIALAFRSAHLPLLQIDAKRQIEADDLYKLMAPYLLRS
ncbi:hypothetical protein DKM44_05475 [Deinococcus irradiatisoli]|uniref:DUF2726 domain-containing protein n=1 Tax=Deinococcus irradiatisoli TaxID=2202254 RepID=A0A2Z3JC59_9DEIO|nr:hypothetical protein [Deinococcus irradiatisoli]AWN22747.1 hypothetical protein DKM44_05475 [Deinococcus irradiatisoli]